MRSVFIFIGLALVCLLIQFSSASFAGGLQFDRAAIGAGQWWRIISGHLVHLSLYHLLLNLCGLALVAYIADHRYPLLTLIAMFWLLLADGLSLYWFAPDLLIYVGLSGALHGALLIAIWYSPLARCCGSSRLCMMTWLWRRGWEGALRLGRIYLGF